MKVLYTAHASSTGAGRNGHVRSDDGLLDTDVAVPKEMGGAGGKTNPEQLFAAGYAACFHNALQLIARRQKVDVSGSAVDADVAIGPNDAGGFELAVKLHVTIPGLDDDSARALVDKADEVCPYSNATRGNIPVELSVN